MFQTKSHAPPRCAWLAIASPIGPPKTISRNSDANGQAGRDDEDDRVEPHLPDGARLEAVVGAVDRLDHGAHRAARGPDREEEPGHDRDRRRALVPRGRLLREVDRVDHRAGRHGAEEVLELVVGADQPEQADEQDDAGEEGEQRAEGDLLREAHAVVPEELLERPLEDVHPLARREAVRPGRNVADVGVSRGRQA